MSRFIVKAVFNGTTVNFNTPGNSVDSVYRKVVRNPIVKRHSAVFLFFNRKTGALVDSRSH